MNLYHYCSNEAFHSIISNREIRLSSLTLSNDYMEGKLIESELLKLTEEDGLEIEQQNELKQRLADMSSITDGLGFCLSEKKDLLSQWRGYASDAHGVSIGFSKKYFESLSKSTGEYGFDLKKVIYSPKEISSTVRPIYQKVKEYIDKGAFKTPVNKSLISTRTQEEIDKKNEETNKLYIAVRFTIMPLILNQYRLKSIAFMEEYEWRLISLLFRVDGPEPCDFQPSLAKIKPYRSYDLTDLNIDPIEEIVLGPKNATPKYIVESFLAQNGFKNVSVISSDATYR